MVLYSAMDLPVGEKLGRAFEAQYPGIEVQIERAGSERLFQRIAQEFASNIHAADVVNSVGRLALHPMEAATAGWRPSCPKTSRNIFRTSIATPTAMFATTRIWLSSIAYNTNLVKPEDAPKSFADLLDPEMGRQDGQGSSRL